MSDAGANQYTFHLEATRDVSGLARKIKETGMRVSCAIQFFAVSSFCERFWGRILALLMACAFLIHDL